MCVCVGGGRLAVSGLAPKDPDPAQLAKLGCMVPAQKLAHISLRITALFFFFSTKYFI